MNKSEAAEALYRAAMKECEPHLGDNPSLWRESYRDLLAAVAAYSRATPDAVPPEVQRVVEAACHVIHTTRVNHPDAADAWGDLETAVDAYRSSQPEPLSARLARLKPGSVVEWARGPVTVIGNYPPDEVLWVVSERTGRAVVDYNDIRAIISESP